MVACFIGVEFAFTLKPFLPSRVLFRFHTSRYPPFQPLGSESVSSSQSHRTGFSSGRSPSDLAASLSVPETTGLTD